MDQLSLFAPITMTVTELTRYLRQLIESNDHLQDLWVYGEISNLTRHSSGHVYFTLKDSSASLRCVIWRSAAERLRLPLQNGMAVEARGSIGIYEPRGEYQLYVTTLRAAGEGLLYQEFLRLKTRLEAEGFFNEERKRPLPPFPHRIGIITSPTGAALQDMLNTLRIRYRLAEIVLAPVAVQGEEAPQQIVNAIRLLNVNVRPDVILLARGGGSLEDLWAFNDEQVVKAVVESEAPVVTGVGHETDFTLVDFAADLRAPTPTGAAVLATPDSTDLHFNLETLRRRLENLYQENLLTRRDQLSLLCRRLRRESPLWQVQNNRQRLDELAARSNRAAAAFLDLRRTRCLGACQRLESLNPLSILQRGYAMVSDSQGKIVKSVHQVSSGDDLDVRLQDGSLQARVTGKQNGDS